MLCAVLVPECVVVPGCQQDVLWAEAGQRVHGPNVGLEGGACVNEGGVWGGRVQDVGMGEWGGWTGRWVGGRASRATSGNTTHIGASRGEICVRLRG